jgi:hypothetical protein
MIAPVDHGHIDGEFPEAGGSMEAAKASSYDDNARPVVWPLE